MSNSLEAAAGPQASSSINFAFRGYGMQQNHLLFECTNRMLSNESGKGELWHEARKRHTRKQETGDKTDEALVCIERKEGTEVLRDVEIKLDLWRVGHPLYPATLLLATLSHRASIMPAAGSCGM